MSDYAYACAELLSNYGLTYVMAIMRRCKLKRKQMKVWKLILGQCLSLITFTRSTNGCSDNTISTMIERRTWASSVTFTHEVSERNEKGNGRFY